MLGIRDEGNLLRHSTRDRDVSRLRLKGFVDLEKPAVLVVPSF